MPELADIPALQREGQADPLTVLGSLGFSEALFKALLQAVMISVASKKKVMLPSMFPSQSYRSGRWSLRRLFTGLCRMISAAG